MAHLLPGFAGLTYLNLNECRLSGQVPPALQAATRLESLCLADNPGLQLDNSWLATLASLPALTGLQLSCKQPQATAAQLADLARQAPGTKISYYWL